MAVIEVPMISGFRADVESLERVKKKKNPTTQQTTSSPGGLGLILVLNIDRPTGILLILLLAVAQKSLCSQVNGQTRRQVGRIEGKGFVHIWRPFVEKHYVMEFIRFLLFPLQTPGSCKHTHLRTMRPEETHINKHLHTRDMDVSPVVQLNKLWMYLSEQDGVKCYSSASITVLGNC